MGVLWITGRPASGKSTLARALLVEMSARGLRARIIDSDEVRAVLTPDPQYTPDERALFYQALAFMALRQAKEGVTPIVAATAHTAEYRQWARELCPGWFLVYARCPLDVCQARDPKGLYREARNNPHSTLPGVGVPFEEPADADYVVDTSGPLSVQEVRAIVDAFLARTAPDSSSKAARGDSSIG
jgi:adenylylsulfate kinase